MDREDLKLQRSKSDGSSTRAAATDENRGVAPAVELRPPVYPAPATYVATSAHLRTVVARLAQASWMAVDLESDSLYHYYDKVCLLQITADGHDYIIDPLQVEDLSLLRPLFENPAIQKIFHAAENDLTLLHRSIGCDTVNIFDTMVAAQIAGHRQFGLGHLLSHYLQLHIDKRYQRYDWSSRPLLEEHLHYARSDTHFLGTLRERLQEEVAFHGRQDQLEEELSLLEHKRSAPRQFNPEDCLKLPGSALLDNRGLKVLRELFIVRDAIARAEDLPVFRIAGHEQLVRMAELNMGTVRDLYRIPGIHPKTIKRHGAELIAAYRRGEASNAQVPRAPKREMRPANALESEVRFQALRKWRQKKAEELDLDLAIVVNNTVLHAISSANPQTLEALAQVHGVRKWQLNRFGQEMLDVLASIKA